MRTRRFVACLLVLIAVITVLYSYRIQVSTLVVTFSLSLSINPESSRLPGFGWIRQNMNFSLIKWPQSVTENVGVNTDYIFNETRTTPVHFVVSLYLNQTRKIISTPDLTITGSYSAVITSSFSRTNQGAYNLTMVVYTPGFEDHQDELERIITVY